MSLIPLNRQFIEWRNQEKNELSDPDILSRLGMHDGAKNWDDLLERLRVVILAEAGSGKSEELKGQARRLTHDNKLAFYATVQDVGREGLENAIEAAERSKLAAWRSTDQSAWFFIDSIDEAKLDGVRFDRALRNVADAIRNAEGRAHIVLSGRHTDWEFRRDLARLQETLPVPRARATPAAPTADELLIRTLHHERASEEEIPEAPLVVVLESLDAERVRIFAQAKGAANLDALIAEIDVSNLWRFARRPLDLDWLVQFWTVNQRLGSLAEMLATSLRERLQESDRVRAHRDPLDLDRTEDALERVGAALVFGRATTLCIPDSEMVLTGANTGFDLDHVLPDWGSSDRVRLLNRPVFDPATFGRVRLHNDNEGVVRAYLAARWLHGLRQANLSRTGLFNLLFADVYGLQLVKPSLQETAAWLSIWDADVAREVIHREPYLLLTAGDPASLPPYVRSSALTRVVERMVANDEILPVLDYDSVKRFTRPDIAPVIRQLWPIHKQHKQARDLLLRLIWLGDLRECADLAAEAVSAPIGSGNQVVAGRAFMATADGAKKAQYAAGIVRDCSSVPPTVVWDAVETLFPSILGIDDLLVILGRVDVTDRDGGIGFQWQSPDLISRIDAPADLERLLVGLLALIGPEPGDVRPGHGTREEALLAAIGCAAYRLLRRSSSDAISVATIDAAIRIGRHMRFNRGSIWEKVGDVGGELRKTSARRRVSFWRAAERMDGHQYLQGRPVQHPWELEMLGWSPGLILEDVDWLLADGQNRETEHKRKLAVNAALYVWARSDRPEAVRDRIRRAAATDRAMYDAYDEWVRPRSPDPALVESELRLREDQEKKAVARAEGDQSWRDFVSRLRADPDQLRRLNPATAGGIDTRLYHLWQLLSSTVRTNSRYAIDSVTAVEPVLGRELAGALRDGLIRHWRTWEPSRKSTRPLEGRNTVRTLDVIGIAGVSLEAGGSSDWASQLDAELARRATAYATLEINGFPTWTADLSARWPTECAAVLHEEVLAELSLPDARFEVLHDIAQADECVLAVMVPSLLDDLEQRSDLPAPALSQLLGALERAPGVADRARLVAIALPRFLSARETQLATLYVAAVFRVDPEAASDALFAKLDGLSVADQTLLVQGVLASIFGDRFSHDQRLPGLSFRILERLVDLAFTLIPVEDTDEVRGAAFTQLTEIPGRATFNALLGLADLPGFPISPQRLRGLARERASKDSEAAPWPPGEAHAFEDKCESLPRTPIDLQRLLLTRLSDLQHSLLHDDFAQGSTLCGLPHERAVQNWIADYLRRSQGRSYTVEREPHVVDENEPDIRARAANDASVPVEIKVAESWSFEELKAALVVQLCGRYLRAKEGRHGILLLVHQRARSRGWIEQTDGRWMDFAEVIEQLRLLAREIAGDDAASPQPEIAVIDVSRCTAEAQRP